MEPSEWIEQNPDKVGGEPIFKDTRVPVRIMYEYLEAGDSLDRFLEHYSTVNPEQARAVLKITRENIENFVNKDVA